MRSHVRQLAGAELEALVMLVERGPLPELEVSSVARDNVVAWGLAVRVVVALKDGYLAATYTGRESYKKHFGGATLEEAHGRRMAGVVERARRRTE